MKYWLHPEAEWAASSFDQRHLLTAQVQYTSGAGVSGGGIMDGPVSKLFRGWTLTSQLTAGSGLHFLGGYVGGQLHGLMSSSLALSREQALDDTLMMSTFAGEVLHGLVACAPILGLPRDRVFCACARRRSG